MIIVFNPDPRGIQLLLSETWNPGYNSDVSGTFVLQTLLEFSHISKANNVRNMIIVIRRFGLDGNSPEAYPSIAKATGISVERTRQIVLRFQVKYRHAYRMDRAEFPNDHIDSLGLPDIARNCLMRVEIRSIEELVTKTADDLLQISNFGKKSLKAVEDALASRGLALSQP